MEKRRILIYVFILLALGAMIVPGSISDFKPSEELAKYSVFIGLAIAVSFWPLIKEISNRTSKGIISRFFVAFIVFPIGITLIGYAASVGSLGFAVNRIIGDPHVTTETIKRKGCSSRRCLCDTKIHLTSNTVMSNGTFCIGNDMWQKLKVGQKIRLSGVSSQLGFDVDKFEIIR